MASWNPEQADELGERASGEERSFFRRRRPAQEDATDPLNARPGQVVGDYGLIRLLGRGGMGQVWEAEERELGRRVALKLMLQDHLSERARKFFAREGRAAARLNHPGIVSIYRVGEADGVSYIAQELVEGSCTLQDFLDETSERGSIPPGYHESVAHFVAATADALEAAHRSNVIHRDVKPRNILVTDRDEPKIVDFGLARIVDEQSLSKTGEFMGTYSYMSPEQLTAKRATIDHRTDVFSLGVVLYELLALQRPFDGDTTREVAERILFHRPDSPSRVRSSVPHDLSVICDKSIEKAPADRFQSMAELAADLRRFLAHETIRARPPSPLQRARSWVQRHPTTAAVTTLGTALVAVSVLLWTSMGKDSADAAARLDPKAPVPWHRGPGVYRAPTGPARFVSGLHDGFDINRALDTVIFADQFYRAPANDGYQSVLDRLKEELQAAGFGRQEGLELEVFTIPSEHPAWNPKRARLTLLVEDSAPETLHSFTDKEGRDRVMLPTNAPSCDLSGPVVLKPEDLEPGSILVTEENASRVMDMARQKGAGAIVSGSMPYATDSSDGERHLDAINYRFLLGGTEMPCMQISPRSLRKIRSAVASGRAVELHLEAEVELVERDLDTLVATIVGVDRPDQAVVLVSHVKGAGACGNASGLAAIAEGAIGITEMMRDGTFARPRTSLAFVWGDEMRMSQVWLEKSGRQAVAGISCDTVGNSTEATGALALLERMPDPGAWVVLPPDEHTPWGAGMVDPESFAPDGLALIARCAMIDVGLLEGGWRSADHPWEGGSDHDVFLSAGVPAVLFWHWTDFTYHTSLDRLERIDEWEMRRTTVAILATALAVADPDPVDLDRYLRSLEMEFEVRVDAARATSDVDLELAWVEWCAGVEEALRELCR